jgi:hypothetical protein
MRYNCNTIYNYVYGLKGIPINNNMRKILKTNVYYKKNINNIYLKNLNIFKIFKIKLFIVK